MRDIPMPVKALAAPTTARIARKALVKDIVCVKLMSIRVEVKTNEEKQERRPPFIPFDSAVSRPH